MPKISYVGNGTTTEFAFNFPFYENTNIVVSKNTTILTSGYTVIGTSAGSDANIPYTGGKVVFDIAPSIIDTITIKRKIPLTRVVDYQPTAKIDPTTLNQDMNYNIEVLKDMAEELQEFYDKYEEIVDKPATEELLEKIDNIDEEIGDFYDDIENGRVMSKDDFYSYATNCVIEIPQDIKLELNAGTLTLKAGSKVYTPNGSGVFNVVTISADKSNTITNDDKYMIFAEQDGSGILYRRLSSQTGSGTTTPTSGYAAYYNTTDNKIYKINNGVVSGQASLPIAIVTVSGGAISSIDQVFNGFGYIGSTVFVLPGVKSLVPDGRNTNGTLKNTKHKVTSVITHEQNLTGTNIPVFLHTDGTMVISSSISYNKASNIIDTGGYYQVGTTNMTAGIIDKLLIGWPLQITNYYNLES